MSSESGIEAYFYLWTKELARKCARSSFPGEERRDNQKNLKNKDRSGEKTDTSGSLTLGFDLLTIARKEVVAKEGETQRKISPERDRSS